MNVQLLLKKLLDLIPLNGSKLSLGRVFALFAILQQFASSADILELVHALLSQHLTATAIVTLLVGWLHKELKKKFPDSPDL